MKKQFITLATAIATFAASVMPTSAMVDDTNVQIRTGDLIKSDQTQTVYYFAPDGRRYVFPNEKTYFTWYPDFSTVKVINHSRLQALPLGRSNVTYRPGVKMVKITTDPRTYVVEQGGVLRHVKTEEIAKTYYGLNWNNLIEDVPDSFFTNYRIGTPIEQTSEYDPANARTTTPTIAVDKQFDETLATISIGTVDQGMAPKSLTVKVGTRVTWVNRDITDHTVTGAAFDSGILAPDQQYTRTFTTVGSFDYHCSIHPAMMGTVNVVP
jgi:plastocyanin